MKNYKYYIHYLNDDSKMKPLHIMLPTISAHIESYDGETKWMYFLIEDDELLDKCNSVSGKVSTSTKKYFDSEPIYNKNF